MLNRFERDTAMITGAKRFIAGARLKRVITSPGARVAGNQAGAGPTFKLIDRNCAERLRAGTQTGQGAFTIDACHIARKADYPAYEIYGQLVPSLSYYQLKSGRA